MSDGITKTMLMNELSGRDMSSKKSYLDIYTHSLNEAQKLWKEAELLLKNDAHERAYFLAFAALEEISKSQLAADVYTGYIEESEFLKTYRNHKEKISRVKWIQLDGNLFPMFRVDGVEIKDFDFKRKLNSMYVDIDTAKQAVSSPSDSVSKEDAESIIKAVGVGLYRIYEVTVENGEQIGTKGFMK